MPSLDHVRRLLRGMVRLHCWRSSGAPKVALCFALLLPTSGLGEGFARISVPVPVEIEGQRVHCQLYLKLEVKTYNLDFDKFTVGPMDKAQSMFATAVHAIRKGDAVKFASVWAAPDEMKGHSEVTVKMSDESVGNWIKVARSNFDFDHLTVVAEALVGPDSVFIFDSTTKAGIKRYALYVGLDQKDRVRLSAVSSATPVDLMVMNAFIAARTAPDEYKPLPNINLRYQYSIPLAGKLDAGPHPVLLEFDGTPMDISLNDQKTKMPTPAVEVLRNAALALESGNNDIYSSSFTPKSQEQVKKWLAAVESRKEERLKQKKLELEKHPQTKTEEPQSAAAPATKSGTAGKPPPPSATNLKFVVHPHTCALLFDAPNAGDSWLP